MPALKLYSCVTFLPLRGSPASRLEYVPPSGLSKSSLATVLDTIKLRSVKAAAEAILASETAGMAAASNNVAAAPSGVARSRTFLI